MECFKCFIIVFFVSLYLELFALPAGDFPLEDCYTKEFDVLLLEDLYYICRQDGTYYDDFSRMWPSAIITSVLVPVYATDDFYIGKENKNTFKDCLNSANLADYYSEMHTIEGEIKYRLKVASVLFNCGLARENSTHVTIIVVKAVNFLPMTIDEMWKLPEMLQDEVLNFKVFVLLLGITILKEPVLYKNFLYIKNFIIPPIVQMALCKTCPSPWIMFGNDAEDYLPSCYALTKVIDGYSLTTIADMCLNHSANLATIENKKELDFIENYLTSFVKEKNMALMYGSFFSEEILIGLKRETDTVVKLFQWAHTGGPRPLVINHWLDDEPDGGPSQSCGAWVFNGYVENQTNPKDLKTSFKVYIQSEGWASVNCDVNKIGLCESSVSIHFPNKQFVIQPASNVSLKNVLTKGEFREFKGKIVSVSAHASNEEFYNFMKEREEEFPLFDCGEDAAYPRYISYTYICDYIDHCSNRRDEMSCFFPFCGNCRSGQCLSNVGRCDTVKDCEDGSDEEDCTDCSTKRCCDGTCLPKNMLYDFEQYCSECTPGNALNESEELYNERCIFMCNITECIFPSQLNDNKTDCTGPEGHLDEILGKLEMAKTCFDKQNRTIWAPKCVYVRDRFGSILGCRDLSHLQNCSDFPCQEGYYKCPGRYCIPIHYVLDGKNDCPSGEDERRVLDQSCDGNFACWASQVCLHPDLVCDGHPDCPNKDDELNCEVRCFPGTRCLAGTLTIDNMFEMKSYLEDNIVDASIRYIDISGYSHPYLYLLKAVPFFLLDLRFSNCNITNNLEMICKWSFYVNVYTLDVSYNLLADIPSNNFPNLIFLNMSFNPNFKTCKNIGLKRLEILDLSNTGLLYLEKTCFESSTNLNHLNLSNTQLSIWNKFYFPSSFTLQTLDLRGAPIINFFEDTFNGLIIKSFLHADNFGLCCPQIKGNGVPSYMCHATEDAISSCTDLISVEIQRILIWVMAGVAVLGNLIVILFRLIWDTSVLKKAYGLFVLNLGLSDLIMGLYLFVIAGADVYYRGVYVLYDKEWKESVICKIASFLATLSSETTTFFIFLITVDRFLVLKFPFGERKFSKTTKIIAVALAWGISFVLALIPVVPILRLDLISSSNTMCVALLLTNQRVSGWEFSLGVFIVLNFVMFSLIALGQLAIFKSMSGNRKLRESTNQNSLRRAQDITVAKQLSLVVLSNFLCWFPVGFMSFLSLSGHMISNDVYAWTVVLVLPVNSAFNPIMYTIPILLEKWETFKHGKNYSLQLSLQRLN